MKTLDKKLWRDLWHLKGQMFAIASVMAAGVASFIMFLSTLDSLEASRSLYYSEYRFPQVFASVKRAPESLKKRLAEIPGINKVDTRVITGVTIDIEDFPQPITGYITSIPDFGEPLLNNLYLKSGRLAQAGREDEIVISDAFAQAHQLKPGDSLNTIIKGLKRKQIIVGTGGSPEWIQQLRPGSMFPDYKRHGIAWMARTPLEHAYDMKGAFNNVVMTLSADANARDVIEQIDQLLAKYGGTGAYERKDHFSHRFLEEEFKQLDNLGGIFPVIFLGVAAFLLNVVITRLVGAQREQIAGLKAFGYSNLIIGLHYFKLVMLIAMLGTATGLAIGSWLARQLSELYMTLFRLPFLEFVVLPEVMIKAALVCAVAALLGTIVALRMVTRLKPAEAMRPEPPAVYGQSMIEKLGLKRLLSAPTRMIVRHLSHRPFKSLLAVLGIAMSCAIVMSGRFQEDTIAYMVNVHYNLERREDLSMLFIEPTSRSALYELQSLPGVEYAEAFRSVSVRLHNEHRSFTTSLHGMEPDSEISRLLDGRLHPVKVPAEGMIMTGYLANKLRLKPGDNVTVEVLEENQAVLQIPLVGLVEQYLGTAAYMDMAALNRALGQGHAISGAYLYIDPQQEHAIFQRLKEIPRIVGTAARRFEIENFHKVLNESMMFWVSIATVFAIVIAVGVVYNSARIILAERSRELASLRVLGFTRGEISWILLGELALLTLAAIPLGLFLGWLLCLYIASMLQNDLYRVPLILEPSTYAFAATIVIVAAAVSALAVRLRLDNLDLIAVLKTKE